LKENKKNRKAGSHPPGFTLLEVVIALAIMAVSFGSILAVQGNAVNAATRAKQMNTVAMLAKNKMVDTEFKIQGKAFDEVRKNEGGTFEPPYEDFSWRSSIKEIKFPPINFGGPKGNTSDAESNKGGGQGNQVGEMLTKLVTKHLSKSIREVTVTIAWKQGTKEQTYDLSTFWVDLNHEFTTSE
jgi:general secretion pathway protein I